MSGTSDTVIEEAQLDEGQIDVESLLKVTELETLLGKPTVYPTFYTPSLLQTISRDSVRDFLHLEGNILPFSGVDIWNAYELSWLNEQGKPECAMAEIQFSSSSPSLIESKSLKLYLNSFSETKFGGRDEVRETMESDLSVNAKAAVSVTLLSLDEANKPLLACPGICLDSLDVTIDTYEPDATLLGIELGKEATETLNTNLFRSICPVTGQPDWASVCVSYSGHKINHQGLLKYLVSYRQHSGFHEQCVEQIFLDIMQATMPQKLTVYARFVRRGGLDINPFRTNSGETPENIRFVRQ